MIHTSTTLEVQTGGMLEFGPRCRKLDHLLFVMQSAIYLRFKAAHVILGIGQRAFEGLKHSPGSSIQKSVHFLPYKRFGYFSFHSEATETQFFFSVKFQDLPLSFDNFSSL